MRSWNEKRKAATAFSKRWKDAYDEKSQAQSSLKEFFAVFGVDAVTVAAPYHRRGARRPPLQALRGKDCNGDFGIIHPEEVGASVEQSGD